MQYVKKALLLVFCIGFSIANAGSYEDFFLAIERDLPHAVQALLQRGFDPNTVNPNGQPALIAALKAESFAAARLLASHPETQVNLRNPQGETALMLAALKGQEKLCRLLLERDADVNQPGWTALHYAASAGQVVVIKLLLENHAYIDAESPNRSTPLMMAAQYGTADAARLLLEAGADPLLKNAQGFTALDLAGRNSYSNTEAVLHQSVRTLVPSWDW